MVGRQSSNSVQSQCFSNVTPQLHFRKEEVWSSGISAVEICDILLEWQKIRVGQSDISRTSTLSSACGVPHCQPSHLTAAVSHHDS